VGLGLAYGKREDRDSIGQWIDLERSDVEFPPYMLRLLSLPNLPLPKNTTEAIQEN